MQQPDSADASGLVPIAGDNPIPDESELVWLGRITAIYGLRGWVKVHSDTDPRNNITKFKSWRLRQRGKWTDVQVLNGRPQGKTIVASLDGVTTPDAASALIGAEIAVHRDDLPRAAPGEFYWTDLLGMSVKTMDDQLVGTVKRMFETGANDVMVVRDERQLDDAAPSHKEILVPWVVPTVITDVDMQAREIIIDWDPDF